MNPEIRRLAWGKLRNFLEPIRKLPPPASASEMADGADAQSSATKAGLFPAADARVRRTKPSVNAAGRSRRGSTDRLLGSASFLPPRKALKRIAVGPMGPFGPLRMTRAMGVLLVGLLVSWSAQGASEAGKSGGQGAGWIELMRSLEKTLAQVLFLQARDKDPKLGAQLKTLAAQAEKLTKIQKLSPDADPSVRFLSKMFASYASEAVAAHERGNRDYARSLVQGVGAYCFACHTRTAQSGRIGSKVMHSPAVGLNEGLAAGTTAPGAVMGASGTGVSGLRLEAPESLDRLGRFQRAQFLAATRRFEQAAEELEGLVMDSRFAATHHLEWESAVRMGVALSVRTLMDPDRALRLVARVDQEKGAALFFRQNAKAWQEALKAWKDEGARRPESEEGYHAEWLRLITQARTRSRFPLDRNADIDWLRVTQTLHEYLRSYPTGRYVSEAYLSLGMSYETLRGMQLGPLHEVYYEACVFSQPHSDLAQSCYQRLEESVHASYTGSAGTRLPSEAAARLGLLHEQAAPGQSQVKSAGGVTP